MAGISILKRLLMKDAMKKSAGSSGIMSLNKNLAKGVDDTVKKWIDSAKKQGQDIDKMGEQELKYLVELNKKPKINVISQDDVRFKKITDKIFGKKGEVVDMTGKTIQKPENIMGGMEAVRTRNDKIQDLAAQLAKLQKEKSAMYGKTDVVTDTVTKIKTMEPVAAMKEANLVISRKGIYKNLTKDESQKILKDTDDWIFQRDPDDLYDYNKKRPFRDDPDVDPEDFAGGGIAGMLGERTGYADAGSVSDFKNWLEGKQKFEQKQSAEELYEQYLEDKRRQEVAGSKFEAAGGGIAGMLGEPTYADENHRVPYKDGTKFNPKRRTILKGLGALAALPVVGKFFKFAKPLAKTAKVADLTSVPIGSASGMPVWFKPLVNKVIREGEDVTAKMSTKEREIVHQISLEGKMSKEALGVHDVRVTQSLDDGTIRVQYNSPDSIGESGVELVYKKGEEIPITKKGKSTSVKEKDEFTASEDDFYAQTTSPDGDFDIEMTDHIVNKVDDLYSDTSKLKQFATGKNLTIKEISEATKKKNYIKGVHENPNDHAFRNAPEYDGPYEDFASGGRVPMLFGGGVWKKIIQNLAKERGVNPSMYLKITNYKALPNDVKKYITPEDYRKMKEGRIEMFENWVEMAKSKKSFQKSIEEGKKGSPHAAPIFEHLEKSFKSVVPSGVTDKDILQGEYILKNLKTKDRKLNATGGRVSRSGGGIMKILKLFKTKPETLKEFIDRRNFLKLMIGNTDNMKNKRMLEEILEENKKVKGFEFPESGIGSDIHKEIETILSKDITKHANGGLAGMLGE